MENTVKRLPALFRVAVCGGTHGNELSGVYLVREHLKSKKQEEDELVSVHMVLANPRAVQQCCRYTEADLNRCFTYSTLSCPVSDRTPYEIIRSQELNNMLGPKGSSQAVDLICDLHNTTSNMGLCIIAYSDCDWICLHIFRYLKMQMPDTPVRYIHYNLPPSEAYSLDSVGKHGFAIEIGPQPHGVVRSDVYTTMEAAVQHMLIWIHLFNSGTTFEEGSVEVYNVVRNVDYPRDSETHNITAAIHPQLQDQDFCLLHPNDPMFKTFSGDTLTYKGKEPLYPFLINEAAYYEKGIALSLARRRCVQIPSIQRGLPEDKELSEEE